MRSEIFTTLLLGASLATARPLNKRTAFTKREVPQEHSHEPFLASVKTSLDIDNPDGILDSVFGLLGNGAAVQGLGNLKDPECLQQETADRAFTNAKAAADVAGMTAALVYRALERNTGKVGLQSNSCTTAAVNPEIAAISQHQDPASDGAAATNKAITLALAQQISAVGGNPSDALKSGTFAPGDVADATGAGNTCDVADDAAGCIFSQDLLVEDASADEISAAVADGAAGAGAAANATSAAAAGNVTVSAANVTAMAAAANESTADAAAQVAATQNNTAAMDAAKAQAFNQTGLKAPSGGYDFGNSACSNPSIAYGNGINGKDGASFAPDDIAVFAQQTEEDTVVVEQSNNQEVIVVAKSICNTLAVSCGAEVIAIQQCQKTVVVIQESKRNDAFAAVIFNQAMGVDATIIGIDLDANKKNNDKKNKNKNKDKDNKDKNNKDKNNKDKNDKNNNNNDDNDDDNDNTIIIIAREPVSAPA